MPVSGGNGEGSGAIVSGAVRSVWRGRVGGVKSRVRGRKKKFDRQNRKNATGRKYVVEIALCRGGVGDRPLLGRHPSFGRVLPSRAEKCRSAIAPEGRREKGERAVTKGYIPRPAQVSPP